MVGSSGFMRDFANTHCPKNPTFMLITVGKQWSDSYHN